MTRIVCVLASVAFLVVSCQSDSEDIPTDTPPTSDIAPDSPTPTEGATVPADWNTYSAPDGLFGVRYPPEWFAEGVSIYSKDPSELLTDPNYQPMDEVEVELGHYEARGSSACGPVYLDPATGEVQSIEPGATSTTLGGQPAWDIVRDEGHKAIQGTLTRIHGIATLYQGSCILVAAYFYQETPDEETFSQIVSSFAFGADASE
jgi:hypothetical protein